MDLPVHAVQLDAAQLQVLALGCRGILSQSGGVRICGSVCAHAATHAQFPIQTQATWSTPFAVQTRTSSL